MSTVVAADMPVARLGLRREDLTLAHERRLEFVDITRAIFVLWMINSHALGRAQVPADSFLQWIRPHGWATSGFVMLSGFSIAVIYLRSATSPGRARRQLWRRAAEIGTVAYLSNLLFESAKLFLDGALAVESFTRLATFRAPWGYSAILIPTTAMLLLAPGLLHVSRRISPAAMFAVATGAALLLQMVTMAPPQALAGSEVFTALVDRNRFVEFPVLSLLVYAIWAFTFARLLMSRERLEAEWPWMLVTACAVVVGTGALGLVDTWNPGFVIVAARLPLVLALALVIARVPWLALVRQHLSAIGQAALLVYVLHRPILQALDLALAPALRGEQLAIALLAPTLVLVLALSHVKAADPRVRLALRKVGF